MDSSEEMNSITYLDPVLFKAAEEGNIDPFEKYQTCLDQLLTPDDNTIFHVYLRNQRSEPKFTDFVDKILQMCPPLLLQANKKGETPLHLAVRYGHSNVVKILIDHAKALPTDSESGVPEAKKMLRMTDKDQDTVLHEAARNIRSHVVKILTKEDPDFSYSANTDGEPPLYIVVSIPMKRDEERERERGKVIHEILTNCISVDYRGPNGTTALHTAILKEDDETARKILDKKKDLTKKTDQKGLSPLHYAACFPSASDIVKSILEYDASAAYIAGTEKKSTALHMAASQGNVNAMEVIVSRCPACCELVDNTGWNVLHYAVASKRSEVFEECLKIPELLRLKTEKDDKGNTPFHLIAALALMHKHKHWLRVLFMNSDARSGIYGLNKRKQSVIDIYEGDFDAKKEILESLEVVSSGNADDDHLNKAGESHLVVAALVATVTFAAAFTLPGGYKNEQGPDQGRAILTKKAAFKAFVISDAISMVLSISAVFIHFLMPVTQRLKKAKQLDEDATGNLFLLAMVLTMVSMTTMIIAFITGTYAVLVPSSGLAISTCLIGSSFFFFVYVVMRIILNNLKL